MNEQIPVEDESAQRAVGSNVGLGVAPLGWLYQCGTHKVLSHVKHDWADTGTGLWTETPLYAIP